MTERERRGELQDDADLAALIALRRARRRRARPRHRFVLTALAIALFVIVASLAGAALTGRALVFGACDLNSLRPVALGSNSFLFASDGSLLGVIPSTTNRQPLRLDRDVALAAEGDGGDRGRPLLAARRARLSGHCARARQERHGGHIVQGGSTITQQLVRNLYIGKADRTLSRKLKEACLAREARRHTGRRSRSSPRT